MKGVLGNFKDRLDVRKLGASKPHGDRLRYMSGCRCTPCRAANSSYETMRAAARRRGEWNGYVPADQVRAHMKMLSRKFNVGRRQVADIAGVAESTLVEILAGRRKHIRALTAKAILAVDHDAVADHALVPAGPTWARLNWLLKQGFTRTELASRLGSRAAIPSLQIRPDFCLAATELKVERLYNTIRAGDEDFEADAANRWVLPFLEGHDYADTM